MRFIVFEGLDGSGKTSLINTLTGELTRQGIRHRTTREPGGTLLAEEVRKMVLRTDTEPPTPETELLLYEASRSQHVAKVIKPALAKGEWVLCDRFTASSVAFQVGGRGLNRQNVDWLNNFATAGTTPHLTVLLELTVEEGARRQKNRVVTTGQELDRFELEKADFHQRVRESYLQQAKEDPKTWLVLDASLSTVELGRKLLTHLREKQWLK